MKDFLDKLLCAKCEISGICRIKNAIEKQIGPMRSHILISKCIYFQEE